MVGIGISIGIGWQVIKGKPYNRDNDLTEVDDNEGGDDDIFISNLEPLPRLDGM